MCEKCPKCGAEPDPGNATRKDWWVAYLCGTGHNEDGTELLEDENCLRRQLAQAREKNTRLLESLSRIQAMCGNPDPAEACRLILKEAAEAARRSNGLAQA